MKMTLLHELVNWMIIETNMGYVISIIEMKYLVFVNGKRKGNAHCQTV